MGFHSYREFKAYLHELSIANATSLEGMKTDSPSTRAWSREDDSPRTRHPQLHALRHTLDMARMVALARRIYEAADHYLRGDLAVSLVEFLDYKLTLLGLPVFTP